MRRLVVPFGVSVLAVAALVPAERAPAVEAPTPAGTMDVTVGEGRLSVNLRNAPLADALRLIGLEARLKINLDSHHRYLHRPAAGGGHPAADAGTLLELRLWPSAAPRSRRPAH